MDNPWANSWEPPPSEPTTVWTSTSEQKPVHEEEADIGLPSWSIRDTAQWSGSTHADDGPLWTSSEVEERTWSPSTYEAIIISRTASTANPPSASPDDEHEPALLPPPFLETQDIPYNTLIVHHNQIDTAPPFQEDRAIVPDADVPGGTTLPLSSPSEDEEPDAWGDPTILTVPDDEWASAWNVAPDSQDEQEGVQPPDEWETAGQEKEKLDRAVPPELLASILRQCQEVLDEIWPESDVAKQDASEKSWQTGFDGLENLTELLNELIPDDFVLPPAVQYPTTATAKAMNEALKLTRHSTFAGSSPLAKLLASKGSLDWQRSVVSKEVVVPDAAPVGWRILDKEEHRSTVEERKPKRGASGLLSFLNRRAPSVPSLPEEVSETSPRRSSIGSSARGANSPQSTNRDTSPGTRSSTSTSPTQPVQQASPETTVATLAPAPSAVSRFLNRFSRTKSTGSQHSSLALSADDLEYLSDIVPSASDPDDEQEGTPKALSNIITSPLPTKLPPPLPPPPKPSVPTFNEPPLISAPLSRPPQHLGQTNSSLLLSLPPPLSPRPISPPTLSLSPAIPPKDTGSHSPSPSIGSAVPKPSSPQPLSRSRSPFTLPPPSKATPLSLPPLLPPPPISPPQTPRPTAVQPLSPPSTSFTPSSSSYMWPNSMSGGDDEGASDEEFFSSFSRSPYRPSHAPSDSTSIRSPESQNSGDRLRSARSSMSQSFDDFDDFVSSPSRKQPTPRSPSPPPLPAKNTPPRNYRMPKHTSRPSVDHQRTQSLIDKASTTKGTWPSPAAPALLVRPIPPPPAAEDLLGFDDPPAGPALPCPPQLLLDMSLGTGEKLVPVTPPFLRSAAGGRMHQVSRSPPPLMPPQPPASFPPLAFMSSPPPLSGKPLPQTAPKPSQMGGLSAQDLSFFEGL